MSFIQKVRERMFDSAVDFALNAFWVALTGAVVTAALLAYAIWSGLPKEWVWALWAAVGTFAFVVVVTVALVWIRRSVSSRKASRPTGRKGLLDFIRDRDASVKALVKNLTLISQEIVRVGVETNRSSARFIKARATGRQRAIDKAVVRLANDLEKSAIRMDLYASRYSGNVDEFVFSTESWLRWMKDSGSPIHSDEFTQAMRKLLASADSSLPNMVQFRDSTEGVRNLSAEIDVSAGRLAGAIDRFVTATEKTRNMCRRIVGEGLAP